MFSAVYLIVTVVVLLWSYYKLRRRHLEKLAAKIPGRPTLPILGNLRELKDSKTREDLLNLLHAVTEQFPEGLRTYWLGPVLLIGVWKPEFLEVILNSPSAITKSPMVYKFVSRDLTTTGIFVSNGTTWKELKKLFNKTLPNKSLEEYHTTFVKRSSNYVTFVKKRIHEGEFDVHSSFGCVLLDMFVETHLGVNLNELEENKYDFNHTFSKFIELSAHKILNYYFVLEPFYYLTKASRELKAVVGVMKELVDRIIQERMQKLSENGEDDCQYFSDFLIKRNLKLKRTKKEIFCELVDIILAGSDTSSTIASSALVFLAMFPEIQQKAYEEQMTIFGDSSRDPSPNDVSSMVYLTRVIKETLRHVTSVGIFRDLSEDLVVGDYTLPKGTTLYLFFQKIHKNPEYWDNPEGFDPDHFLPDKVASRHRYAYLPFSYGARGCPGYQYGMNSIKVLLSQILRNFKLSTSLKFEEIQYKYSLLVEISAGYKVKFEERKNDQT